MNILKTIAISCMMSTAIMAAPTAQDYFKELIGQEFVDDGSNTVHEWVCDFLLAVEEGDEALLRDRLTELKHVDAGNRAVLLNAGVRLAKELHRDRHWQMLKRRLNRIAAIPASFSLEAAEACELTNQRNAEKAHEAGNWSVVESLMSNTAFKTAFIVAAGMPVAAAGTLAANLPNVNSGGDIGPTSISPVTQNLFAQSQLADLPYLSDAYQRELRRPQRDFKGELDRLVELSHNSYSPLREEFKELIPHLLSNTIDAAEVWESTLAGKILFPSVETGVLLLLEAGADPNFEMSDGRSLLYHALVKSQHDYKYESIAELLLEFGADPLMVVENQWRASQLNLRYVKLTFSSLPAAFFERIKEFSPSSSYATFFSGQIREEFNQLSNPMWGKGPIEKISNIWISLIKKGLPFDVRAFLESSSRGIERYCQREFIKKLIDSGAIDINARVGMSFFENVILFGNTELVKIVRDLGGHTDRPIVAVLTSTWGGAMLMSAIQALRQRGVLTITFTPPFELLTESIHYYAKAPRAMLNSGIREVEQLKELARDVLSIADAVWLSGGTDVWWAWYSDRSGRPSDLARDVLEMAILDLQSKEPYKPLIGVCRGIQMINVFYGGTLREVGQSGMHPLVVLKKDGHLASALPERASGLSAHSQSIDQLAESLEAVAMSEYGMVKAVQSKSKDIPLMGTQFHPESDTDRETGASVLKRFVEMAEASKRQTCFEPESAPRVAN
jgi:putative glutamine amidotransferase